MLKNRPAITYDVLSIDIGSAPDGSSVPGAKEFTTAVKPISTFIERLHGLLASLKRDERPQVSPFVTPVSSPRRNEIRVELSRRSSAMRHIGQRGFCVAVVGGGAGGVELAFAMKYRLHREAEATNQTCFSDPVIKIIAQREILSGYPPSVRNSVLALFAEKNIEVFEDYTVVRVTEGTLEMHNGSVIHFDGCLWCTQAGAAPWLRQTDLWTDEKGFIKINDFLQPFNGPAEIFAAGDIASSVSHPRPKAGVFAVRQGPPLAANIRRFLQGEELQPFIPQTTYLSLISTGNKYCVANKGWLFWQGPSMWKLKDSIDRAFMHKYEKDLPEMDEMTKVPFVLNQKTAANLLEKQAAILVDNSKMRCAGCGGKIGMNVLQRVLKAIVSSENGSDDVIGYDDAAILHPPEKDHLLLQTNDFLKSFISDPYVFGQITALHCLSDIYAMGGQPVSLLSTAVVPFGTEEKMEADLIQVMLGAKKTCDEAGCKIVGGHTAEGMELSLGFTVIGAIQEKQLLRKTGVHIDQTLILTKPLGTGLILAAEMRGKAKATWVKAAVDSMLTSNGPAAKILQDHGATACTDVTGFGLLGHLSEMLSDQTVSAALELKSIPMLPGCEECSKNGWLSSLNPQNSRVQKLIDDLESFKYNWELPVLRREGVMLVDGGLLASVPTERAETCVASLHAAGLPFAAIIGNTVTLRKSSTPKFYIQGSEA